MIKVNELEVLIVLILGFMPLFYAYLKKPETRFLFFGYILLLSGSLLSVFEDFYFPEIFNFLEHSIGVMLAGIIIFVCAYVDYKHLHYFDSKINEKIKEMGS